jgi:hypothetical protein
MNEERKVTPITKDFDFWLGRAEARKLRRLFFVFPLVAVAAVLVGASIILIALLWHVPDSADTVSRLFAVEMFRENFPKAARLHSYLAQKYGGPWDIFLPAITMFNIVACSIATVLTSLWISLTQLKVIRRADSRNLKLVNRADSKAVGLIFFLILIVIPIVAAIASALMFGWGGNPNRDFSKSRRAVELVPIFAPLMTMCLVFLLLQIPFLMKFRRMLNGLQREVTTST